MLGGRVLLLTAPDFGLSFARLDDKYTFRRWMALSFEMMCFV